MPPKIWSDHIPCTAGSGRRSRCGCVSGSPPVCRPWRPCGATWPLWNAAICRPCRHPPGQVEHSEHLHKAGAGNSPHLSRTKSFFNLEGVLLSLFDLPSLHHSHYLCSRLDSWHNYLLIQVFSSANLLQHHYQIRDPDHSYWVTSIPRNLQWLSNSYWASS